MKSTTKKFGLLAILLGLIVLPGVIYTMPPRLDSDSDGLEDALDNCPTIPNPTQEDLDGDNIGDVCDKDRDGDGLSNAFEISLLETDPDDWDTDDDDVSDFFDCEPRDSSKSLGSDCDEVLPGPPPPSGSGSPDPLGDEDRDGVINRDDNCPVVFNPNQADLDEDGLGDVCDPVTAITPPPLDLLNGVLSGGGAGCSLFPRPR